MMVNIAYIDMNMAIQNTPYILPDLVLQMTILISVEKIIRKITHVSTHLFISATSIHLSSLQTKMNY